MPTSVAYFITKKRRFGNVAAVLGLAHLFGFGLSKLDLPAGQFMAMYVAMNVLLATLRKTLLKFERFVDLFSVSGFLFFYQ